VIHALEPLFKILVFSGLYSCPYLQWVLIELTQDAKTVLIAGESYQPYLLIDYKYDNPTLIHYHFGIARMACTNGIISGLKFFGNQKVKTEDFSICDPFFNPCIMDVLIGRYDLLFTALKKINVNEDQFQQLFEMMLGRKLNTNNTNPNSKMKSSENMENEITHFHMLSEKYSEMGNNMFRVLNMFTDYATHYYGSNYHDEENEIHQQVVSLQKKAGEFLDDLFEYFEKSEYFLINEDLSSETFGHRSINLEREADIENIINALSKNK